MSVTMRVTTPAGERMELHQEFIVTTPAGVRFAEDESHARHLQHEIDPNLEKGTQILTRWRTEWREGE